MKLKQTIILSIFAIAGLTSCEKNLYEPNQGEDENLKLTDLTIPDNFDWKMIENGKFTITSEQAVKVSIYSDESLNEKGLLATVGVKSGENVTLPISLVRGAKNVYVQYENASGIKDVKSATIGTDGSISVTIPNNSTTRALTDDDFIKDGSATLYYPNMDFGTIMFEDNYPSLGDYDFNDFVADYNIQIQTSPNNTNQINKITLIMQVKAIGANQNIHHYIPHLSLPIPKECIEKTEITTRTPFNKESDWVEVKDVTDKSVKRNYIVLAFNGAELNSQKNQESEFLNTEKDCKSPTKTFVVDITFKPYNEIFANLEYIKADGFDIFLATANQSQEIHMNGFSPVFTLENKPPYKDKDNYVWGINMPNTTPQVYEKANFIKAYPDFKTWLTNPSFQWYKNGNKDFLFE